MAEPDVRDPLRKSLLSAFHDVTTLRDYSGAFTEGKQREIAAHAAAQIEEAWRRIGFSENDLVHDLASETNSGLFENWTGLDHAKGHGQS